MSKEHDGANGPRAVDLKALDPVYILAETAKDNLLDLFNSLEVVGLLTESSSGCGPDVTAAALAPLHRTLSSFGKRLMADLAPEFPALRESGVN